MQSAENWRRYNATDNLNGTRYWHILVQSEMRANAVVLFAIQK
jgi:hypothetical protein